MRKKLDSGNLLSGFDLCWELPTGSINHDFSCWQHSASHGNLACDVWRHGSGYSLDDGVMGYYQTLKREEIDYFLPVGETYVRRQGPQPGAKGICSRKQCPER